jgi:hypothetical protein
MWYHFAFGDFVGVGWGRRGGRRRGWSVFVPRLTEPEQARLGLSAAVGAGVRYPLTFFLYLQILSKPTLMNRNSSGFRALKCVLALIYLDLALPFFFSGS